jgi:hypothetical protein
VTPCGSGGRSAPIRVETRCTGSNVAGRSLRRVWPNGGSRETNPPDPDREPLRSTEYASAFYLTAVILNLFQAAQALVQAVYARVLRKS